MIQIRNISKPTKVIKAKSDKTKVKTKAIKAKVIKSTKFNTHKIDNISDDDDDIEPRIINLYADRATIMAALAARRNTGPIVHMKHVKFTRDTNDSHFTPTSSETVYLSAELLTKIGINDSFDEMINTVNETKKALMER